MPSCIETGLQKFLLYEVIFAAPSDQGAPGPGTIDRVPPAGVKRIPDPPQDFFQPFTRFQFSWHSVSCRAPAQTGTAEAIRSNRVQAESAGRQAEYQPLASTTGTLAVLSSQSPSGLTGVISPGAGCRIQFFPRVVN